MNSAVQALLIPLSVLGVGLVMMLFELRNPGRKWPEVSGWYLRAIFLNLLQVGTVILSGKAWDGWMLNHRPWNADVLGVTAGAIIGYIATTLVYYWWHRWRHESDFLWRWFHQVHHSPQRIEVITSFYKHPLEIFVNGILSSAILYLVVGVGTQAATYAILISGLAELVYHWNISTPYWLGFIFQRPESHCVHHEKNKHSSNYSDLPLWDMLFGTFDNPKAFDRSCGFEDANEHRLPEMLIGRKIE